MEKLGIWLAKTRQFITDTVNELHKCSWPARSELFESTVLVIVTVLALAGFVAVVDVVFVELISRIIM